MSTKICIKCSGDKPIGMFYEHPGMKDGHLNKCISCCIANSKANRMSPAAQKWRVEHREEQLEKQRPNKRRWKKEHRERISVLNAQSNKRRKPVRKAERRLLFDKIKSDRGCKDCRTTNPIVLDFHHLNRDEKKMAISTMIMRNYATETIIAEMAKCIVVCANCHRIRHNSNRWKS